MSQHWAVHFVMNEPWYRQRHNMSLSITKILAELYMYIGQLSKIAENKLVSFCCLKL